MPTLSLCSARRPLPIFYLAAWHNVEQSKCKHERVRTTNFPCHKKGPTYYLNCTTAYRCSISVIRGAIIPSIAIHPLTDADYQHKTDESDNENDCAEDQQNDSPIELAKMGKKENLKG